MAPQTPVAPSPVAPAPVAPSPVALVTGAAGGIGRASVERLLARGWTVGAFDVDQEGLGRLTAAGASGTLVTGHLDVRDAEGWRAALDRLCGADGLDLLLNNAGLLEAGAFEEVDLDRQRRIVEVNVTGVLTGAHAGFAHLQRRGGLLLNLCSASAIYGQPELATYSATKFAVRGLTEALDLEWAEKGVSVAALWPLFVETGMIEGVSTGSMRGLGVRLTPAEVADDVVRLATRHLARRRTPSWARSGWAPRSPHHFVGAQARVMAGVSQVSPDRLTRLVTRALTRIR